MIDTMSSIPVTASLAAVDELRNAYARLTARGEPAASTGALAPVRVFWLTGADERGRARALAAFRQELPQDAGIIVDCERPFPLPFEPVKDVLRQLLPIIEAEAPFLIVEFGPELLALLPELGDRPYLRETLPLTLIALGGTKRRLHKDSEQLFRIVYAFASLVLEAKANCPSLADRPLVLLFDHLDAADRLTLSCVFHLCRRLGDADILVAFAAPDSATWDEDRPWLWADGYDDGLSTDAAALTDAYAAHSAVLQRVLDALQPRRLICAEPGQTEVSAGSAAGPAPRVERAMAPMPRTETGMGNGPGGRSAVARRAIDSPAKDPSSLTGGRSEATLTPLAYHTLRDGDIAAGLRYTLGAAAAALGFSMNLENALFCCRELLRHTEGRAAYRALEVAAWQLVGVTQSYLERQDRALRAFELAYARSDVPEVRAQTCYYAGLVAAKRDGNHTAGLAWFARGLREIEDVETPEAWLERGWLHNGMAFVAWRQGRYVDAQALVQQALTFMQPYGDVQALNLRGNMINNLSLLFEEQGDYRAALETWRILGGWADLLAGGTLAKHYFYREGWLLFRLGAIAEASAACARAFVVAEQVRDFFHMDLISRACGYLACRQRRYDEALYWFDYNRLLREKLDDRRRLPESWAALGHTAVQAGDRERAISAFRAGLVAAAAVGRADLAASLREALAAAEAGALPATLEADAAFWGILLERPRAKLTAPFALAHLSSDAAFVPAMHQSLLGGEEVPGG